MEGEEEEEEREEEEREDDELTVSDSSSSPLVSPPPPPLHPPSRNHFNVPFTSRPSPTLPHTQNEDSDGLLTSVPSHPSSLINSSTSSESIYTIFPYSSSSPSFVLTAVESYMKAVFITVRIGVDEEEEEEDNDDSDDDVEEKEEEE